MQFDRLSGILAALSLTFPLGMASAFAGEKTLEFELLTKFLEPSITVAVLT